MHVKTQSGQALGRKGVHVQRASRVNAVIVLQECELKHDGDHSIICQRCIRIYDSRYLHRSVDGITVSLVRLLKLVELSKTLDLMW